MNLEKLLAENMLRFGVKNLNESFTRTLLNEGLKAGELGDYSKGDIEDWPAEVRGHWQKYSQTKVSSYFGDGSTFFAAALATAVTEKWNSDKKLQKQTSYSIIDEDINIITLISDTIQYSNQAIDVYPNPNYPDYVATIGTIGRNKGITAVRGTNETTSNYQYLIDFMNRFNFTNVANRETSIGTNPFVPDYNQYDLSQMVNTFNFVDLYKTTIVPKSLIWYSPGNKQPSVAGKETGTQTVGASAPQPKQYDISFDVNSAAIPANDPEISRAVQDAIAMFPDGNITNLTVISSASPEFNSKAGGPKTLADYGQRPLTGTGKPAAGTDNISKNIELAYNRGVSFMNSLNAGLQAQGKPTISKYTVQWQISDKGGSKVPGRYAEVRWEKAGTPGKEVGTMKSTGTVGDTISGKETFTIFQHKFTW